MHALNGCSFLSVSFVSVHPTTLMCVFALTVTIAEQLCCVTVLVRRCVDVWFCFLFPQTDFLLMYTRREIYRLTFSLCLTQSLCTFLQTFIYPFHSFIHSFDSTVHFIAFVKTVCSHQVPVFCVPIFFISSSTKRK